MVTAELAVSIPVVVLVLTLALGAVRLGMDEVRCIDAARLAARALARGDPEGDARGLAARAAPFGASVSLRVGATEVTADVEMHSDLRGLRPFSLHASSTAMREQP